MPLLALASQVPDLIEVLAVAILLLDGVIKKKKKKQVGEYQAPRNTQDSQGQILALAILALVSRQNSFNPCELSPLHSEAEVNN